MTYTRPAINGLYRVTADCERQQWRRCIVTWFWVIECNTLGFGIIEGNAKLSCELITNRQHTSQCSCRWCYQNWIVCICQRCGKPGTYEAAFTSFPQFSYKHIEVNTNNNMGLTIVPCFTPFLTEKQCEYLPFQWTLICWSVEQHSYKMRTMRRNVSIEE